MTKKVIIMRGASGSGKSTLAKQLHLKYISAGEGYNYITVSADSYFMKQMPDNTWQYVFNPAKLGYAHKKCQDEFVSLLENECDVIIVDNTNTRPKEARFYAQKAKEFGYEIEILEPYTEWKYNVDELEKRTQHGVPREVLQGMVNRIKENQYTVEDLLN